MALGILSKLYTNTGSYGSPTWTEVSGVRNVKVGATWKEADATTRASRIERMAKTVVSLEFTGQIKVDSSDTNGYVAFLAAMHSDTALDLMILNGASTTNGVTGYRLDVQVTAGSEDQGNDAYLFLDFTLKPYISANVPSKVLVTTGAPVFSSL